MNRRDEVAAGCALGLVLLGVALFLLVALALYDAGVWPEVDGEPR